MAKKLRRRRGRNERLGSPGAVVVLPATTWLSISVEVAVVVIVLLVMFRTRREAIVVAIVLYALYLKYTVSRRV